MSDKMLDSFCSWAADKETLRNEDELAREEEQIRKKNCRKWISSSWTSPKSDDPYSYHTSESGLTESEVAAKRARLSPWSDPSSENENAENKTTGPMSFLDGADKSSHSDDSFRSEKQQTTSGKPNIQKLRKSSSCMF